jgi:hypothetical protein
LQSRSCPHKDVEDGVASLVFVAGISIKPRHACVREAALRRRILEERLTAAPCHPASRTAKRRPDGIRSGATLISRSRRPVLLPEHTAASGRHRDQRHDVSGVVEGLYRQVRENRGLVRPGVPTPPLTDDRLVHPVKDTRNDPAAVEPIRSMSVKARRIWSWPPMPTRLGQPRFAVVDLRPPLNTKSEPKKVARIPCISADRIAL